MAAPLEPFDPFRDEPVAFHSQAAEAHHDEADFFNKDLRHLLHDSITEQCAHQAGAPEPWGLLHPLGGGSIGPPPPLQEQQQEDISPRTVQETMSLDLSGGSAGSTGSSSSAAAVAAAEAKLAAAEGKLAAVAEQLRRSEAQGRAAAAAAGAEVAQARAKALALEEELRTARELIEDNGGLYDEAFVSRVLTEHAQLKAQVTDSTDVLIRAAQAAPEEEDEPGGGGCLKGVLRLKGVGFVEFGEVERALRKDHVSKETVEALFDAMGGMVTDASFEVFQRRMGQIVGEDREAVKAKLAAVPLTGKKRPRPEALDALAALFCRKRREMEETNPSGVYASYKLWSPQAGREQTLAEAVRAVVCAHGQLRAQLAAAKAENAALRRQVYGSAASTIGGGGRSPVPAAAGAGVAARGRSVSPVPPSASAAGAAAATRGRSRSPVPAGGAGRR